MAEASTIANFYRVKKIDFALDKDRHRIRLGGRAFGAVFAGTAILEKIGKPGRFYRRKVAIKEFRKPLPDSRAGQYSRVIQALLEHGSGLPLTLMHKHEGRWVQVQSLFGSEERGSSLLQSVDETCSWNSKKRLMIESVKAANAGFLPHFDFVAPFVNSGRGAIPLDLDKLLNNREPEPEERAYVLFHQANSLRRSKSEESRLLKVALKYASDEIRPHLENRLKDINAGIRLQ